jgi:hypothetical protein
VLEKRKEKRFNAFSETLRELETIFAGNYHKKMYKGFSKIK